eukprot:Gb_16688 [translate_table: standard]
MLSVGSNGADEYGGQFGNGVVVQQGGQMDDNELEEGEACYYQDDCNYDPDVALSYIGGKGNSNPACSDLHPFCPVWGRPAKHLNSNAYNHMDEWYPALLKNVPFGQWIWGGQVSDIPNPPLCTLIVAVENAGMVFFMPSILENLRIKQEPFLLLWQDVKLQDVLGHFQKDFEGGVSAENLASNQITKVCNLANDLVKGIKAVTSFESAIRVGWQCAAVGSCFDKVQGGKMFQIPQIPSLFVIAFHYTKQPNTTMPVCTAVPQCSGPQALVAFSVDGGIPLLVRILMKATFCGGILLEASWPWKFPSSTERGAKFGGYGSFLPTHQRSSSVLLQPKTPAIVQNNSTQKSPNEGAVERIHCTAASSTSAALPSKLALASNNILSGSAASAADIANKKEMAVTVTKGSGDVSPWKKESVVKNVTGGDQKKLKLRIKMGSDSVRCRKNTAIYSGLGLENSPSPSLEDSSDNSRECSPEDEYSPVQSPLSIIRIMTSHQIPGGFLLTPLRDILLHLSEKDEKSSLKDDKGRAIKTEIQEGPLSSKNDTESVKDLQGPKEKKGRTSDKKGKYIEIKNETDTEMERNATNTSKKDIEFESKTVRELGGNNLKHPTKSSSKDSYQGRSGRENMADAGKEHLKRSDILKEVVKGPSKDKVFSSDLARDEHKEADGIRDLGRVNKGESGLMLVVGKQAGKQKEPDLAKEAVKGSSHKDSTSDLRKIGRESVKDTRNNDLLKDSTGYRERNEQKNATKEMFKEKVSGKVNTTHEMSSIEKERGKEHASANKRRPKELSRNMNSCKEASKEKTRDVSREVYKDPRKNMPAKDSLTCETFGEGGKVRKESGKASVKDYHRDYVKDTGQEQAGTRKDSIEIGHKDDMKESRPEHFEKGSSLMTEREKEREHGVTKVSGSKKLERDSVSEVHASNAIVSQPLPGVVTGTDAGLVPVVPVFINENWVLCDACEKWRLLPCGVEPSSLPKKWLCRMLYWLPDMNRCDISEDATTQALYAMYGQQPGQGQVDANKGQPQLPGALLPEPVHDYKQGEPNHEAKVQKLNMISSNSKKGQVQKSIPNVPGPANPSSSLSRKSKQSSVKSKSLNDVVQQPLEQILGNIGVSHQAIKGSDLVPEKHKSKQKEKWKLRQNCSDEGQDAGQSNNLTLKTKRKREGEPEAHKSAKKIKAEDAVGAGGDFFLDSNSSDRVGPYWNGSTPVKSSGGKAKKMKDSLSPKKDFKHELREGSLATDKKFKDQLQGSIETDSKGTYSGFDTGKFDRKEFSTKKRKIKEWKESQASQEGLQERDYILDGRVTVKEEESETEHRREKKTKTSKSDGKESSASKADGRNERKGKVTRILVSSSKDLLPNGKEEKTRGGLEKEHELGQSRVRGVAQRVSDGNDIVKKDLGYRQPFVAATSSSSKVSCSLKNLANFPEVRGSPVESVSSSPLRISKVEKISLARRNSVGVDDLMDTSFPCLASPRRCSDAEGDAQSDHSGPDGKTKTSCFEQPGSHESWRGVQSSVLNSGRANGENHDRDGKQFSDTKTINEKFHRKLDRSSTDGDHLAPEYDNLQLVNGVNIVERQDRCFSERREKEWTQEKFRDRYSTDGCQERKGSREKLIKDQERDREKNTFHDKGKDKMHDCVNDCHEEFYVGAKNVGSRHPEGHLEGHACSPYDEVPREGKEHFDDKRSNKADKERRKDMEWNSKHDTRPKKPVEGRKGNQLKHDVDENIGVLPSDVHTKQNGDYISRHGKAGTMPWKDGKANLQKSFQHGPSRGEKASNQSFSDRNLQSETVSIRGKSQANSCSRDKLESQGHGSGAGHVLNKGNRLDGIAVDASNGDFSRVPRESSKADILHGAPSCGLKPPAFNGFAGRDPEGAIASPIRKEHGQAAANAMKEAKDLKHSADRLKNTGGNELESTGLYFRAALKFLHGASLLEPCNADNAKHGETTQSMTVYTDTARLCEFCAVTYERNKEMAAAALAYKCMGVAHMRVVVSKNVCLSRDRHELQMAVQMVPPGESPSSSASDVDNLNNHALMDKSSSVNPAKIVGSPQVAGNHVIVARHRPHFLRLLQYTQDVNAGIEAFRKSESAFAAANSSLDDANYGTEGISAVKRVIDFNFHDIDGLLRLVLLAMEAIYH